MYFLAEYELEVYFRPGENNREVYYLSRVNSAGLSLSYEDDEGNRIAEMLFVAAEWELYLNPFRSILLIIYRG